MKKLSDIEMQKIEGGNSYITAAFLLLYKAGKSFYGFETGVFATRWVGGDRSFEEMPKNQHLMENAGFRKSSENPYRPI